VLADGNLAAWYELLQGADRPTATAEAYATLCDELRAKGNPEGTSPQFLVCNTGQGQCRIISCLFEQPASIPDMPVKSPFAQPPYIAIVQNKAAQQEEWTYRPITAADLFASHTDRRAAWATLKAPPRNDNGSGYGKPRGNGDPTPHFPILPLFGKTICTEMVQLLYPPDAAADYRATLKQVGHLLKPYVDSIPTEATHKLARASPIPQQETRQAPQASQGITNSTAGNQAGTTSLNTDAADTPAAQAAIKA